LYRFEFISGIVVDRFRQQGFFLRIRSGFAPFDLKQQRPNRCRWPMVLGEE